MKFIAHRKNTVEELIGTPICYGIEVDIRSIGKDLVIHHDPFVQGVDFKEWISHYRHGTLILNVKEEGLEREIIKVMSAHGLDDFFFLDQSFPFLVKWANLGEKRCAVRVSEFESVETALTLAGRIDWVWVDCFTKFPLSSKDYARLKEAGFRLCLVSPELQGRKDQHFIEELVHEMNSLGIEMDAICTKTTEVWQRFLGI